MKKLGIQTFAEFKLLLASEESAQTEKTFHMDDIANNYHRMIDELKEHDYRRICRLIYEAETIYLYGSGNEQKAIAEEFKRIFLIFGKCCIDLFDVGKWNLPENGLKERIILSLLCARKIFMWERKLCSKKRERAMKWLLLFIFF